MSQALRWTKQQYDDYCRKHALPNAATLPLPTEPKAEGRQPNKTEAAFGLILEARKRKGEIEEYRYEGITLRWGDGMKYTPDFFVRTAFHEIILIEIKGGHIWDRDMVRFKGCRAEWKHIFDFEMHQKKAGIWTRLM